ncbi:MAG: protein kinase [Snowella sp.]|nr:protein kinase [Snowella sp.]
MTDQETNQIGNVLGFSRDITGRFEIVKQVARGGFGSIYKVKDKHNSSAILALKKIDDQKNRFEREVKINRMLDRVIAEFRNEHCFVIPWIEGVTMEGLLTQSSPSLDQTMLIHDFLKDVLEKLQSIHSKEIVHRDLNPRNLMYREDSKTFEIIDFGMSCFKSTDPLLRELNKMDDGHSTTLTQGLGNFGYSAPENIPRKSRPHYASDLYSLGAIAIRWATGVKPEELTGENKPELLQQAWNERKSQAPVSGDLAEIISRMVAPDLTGRYKNCGEVLEDLRKINKKPKWQGSLQTWI